MTEIFRPCFACTVGLYEECVYPEEIEDGWIIPCWTRFARIESDEPVKRGSGERGRPVLDPSEITDPTSTGRKRAAVIAPILTGMTCEWAGLKWAGGGPRPLVGCAGTTLADVKRNADLPEGIGSRGDRHHGPDKATLNNSPGVNLHRICASCHTRWHELNDPSYATDRSAAEFEWLPSEPYWMHDPTTKATDEERAQNEAYWAMAKKDRTAYPVELPDADSLRYPANESILNNDDNPFEEPSNLFN